MQEIVAAYNAGLCGPANWLTTPIGDLAADVWVQSGTGALFMVIRLHQIALYWLS